MRNLVCLSSECVKNKSWCLSSECVKNKSWLLKIICYLFICYIMNLSYIFFTNASRTIGCVAFRSRSCRALHAVVSVLIKNVANDIATLQANTYVSLQFLSVSSVLYWFLGILKWTQFCKPFRLSGCCAAHIKLDLVR